MEKSCIPRWSEELLERYRQNLPTYSVAANSPPDRVTRGRVRGSGVEEVRQAEGRACLGRMHAISFKKTPHCYCGDAMLVMTAVTREDRQRTGSRPNTGIQFLEVSG